MSKEFADKKLNVKKNSDAKKNGADVTKKIDVKEDKTKDADFKIEAKIPKFDKDETEGEKTDKFKKKRGRKKGQKGKKPAITVDLPIGIAIKELTKMLSRKNKKWLADDSECDDIEEGFNKWLSYRLPQIEKYSPEAFLILPVLCYVLKRV